MRMVLRLKDDKVKEMNVEEVEEQAAKKVKKASAQKEVFSKAQFLSSEGYRDKRDLVMTLLEDEKMYAKAEVEKILDEFLNRRFD